MKEINNEQNSVIFQIDSILNKMSNQVNFLIRNKKLMNQLDVDLLMENTRKLYDTLCSVKCNMDVDSIPMEIEETRSENFESEGLNSCETEEFEEEIEEEESDNSEIEKEYKDFEISFDDDIEEDIEEEFVDSEEEDYYDVEEENIEEEEYFEEEEPASTLDFEFELEDDDTNEEEHEEETAEEEPVVEEIEEEEVIEDAPEEKPEEKIETPIITESESTTTEDSGIRAYKKVYTIDAQTLGDKLESAEDNSLAARLQRKPVSDLATAIGINDKFLLLNELFGGSMEKYNKSIRALNSFSTLLGAKTYMSELQIEFQWDCSSDAYKKLTDLVERRFM